MEQTILKGNCVKCGECCRGLVVKFELNEKQMQELADKDWLNNPLEIVKVIGKPCKYFDFSEVTSLTTELVMEYTYDKNKAYKSGSRFAGVMRGVECKALVKRGNKYICSIYKDRPTICKNYPRDNTKLKDECGYKKVVGNGKSN